jgi:hypothetical protein
VGIGGTNMTTEAEYINMMEGGLRPVFQNKHNKRMIYLSGIWVSDTGTTFFRARNCDNEEDISIAADGWDTLLYDQKLNDHWVYLHYSYTKTGRVIDDGDEEE